MNSPNVYIQVIELEKYKVQILEMLTMLITTTWLVRVLSTTSYWTLAGEEVVRPQSHGFILAKLVP